MYPSLYLTDEQKKKLDNLILLDPDWLTRMMRNVMKLQTGRGSELSNNEKLELKKTGCVRLSSLRKSCWNELNDGDFANLILMLQSFCLIFPLHQCEFPAPVQSSITPVNVSSTQDLTDTRVIHHTLHEEPPSTISDTFYLIPSKLCNDISQPPDELLCGFKFSFVFDFFGFLPEQVYHRLLCLMLKRRCAITKPREEFTAKYFIIKGVEDCNWIVQMVDAKLHVWVLYPPW